jgi:hypothetical protein
MAVKYSVGQVTMERAYVTSSSVRMQVLVLKATVRVESDQQRC